MSSHHIQQMQVMLLEKDQEITKMKHQMDSLRQEIDRLKQQKPTVVEDKQLKN